MTISISQFQRLKSRFLLKLSLSTIIIFTCIQSYSQDKTKIKEIDSLVSIINKANFSVKLDTLNQSIPGLGMGVNRILTTKYHDDELLKHINFVKMIETKDGKILQKTGSNAFYYHDNKLIKVDEYLIENDIKNMDVSWYFWNGSLMKSSINIPNSNIDSSQRETLIISRAKMLIEMSKNILEDFRKK